jgi:hypothetical protein
MPTAPPSRARPIQAGSLAGTRTTGVMPAPSAAMQICEAESRLAAPCSRSMKSQWKPQLAAIGAMEGARACATTRPAAIRPAASRSRSGSRLTAPAPAA